MKLFIIGKTGQLGQELIAQGEKAGHDVVALGQEEFDMTNADLARTFITEQKPDIVVNAAAYNAVPNCETETEIALKVNTIAVRDLARICKDLGCGFVTYGTDYVFDGTKDSPYTEEDTPNPLQMYGLSKFAGEIAARNEYDKTIIIRTSGVYGGKTGSPVKGNFVLYILKEAQENKELEVSSEQHASPTYAVDLAKASLELLKKNPDGGLYHLVNEGHCSWAVFAQEVVKIKRLDLKIIPVDRGGVSGGMKRPKFSVIENTKAKELGIQLPPWQDAVARYIQWLEK